MARVPRVFIADDGTQFPTAGEARAHNERPLPSVQDFLRANEFPMRKHAEYLRLLNAYENFCGADQK